MGFLIYDSRLRSRFLRGMRRAISTGGPEANRMARIFSVLSTLLQATGIGAAVQMQVKAIQTACCDYPFG